MDISQQIISRFESILNDPVRKEELENDINGWCRVNGLLMGDGNVRINLSFIFFILI